MSAIFLIGFMGAGKSTVGRLLAGRLGVSFVDLDEEVVREEGRSVEAIFADVGEDGFRRAERRALASVAGSDAVVACGGGAVTDAGSRAVLARSGTVVYLRVSSDEALARCGAELSGRPLLRSCDPAAAAALLASRESLYATTAALTVDTDGRTPEQVADEIAAALGARA